MMLNLQTYKDALFSLPPEISEGEAEGKLEDKVKVVVRDGQLGSVESSSVTTIAVRATGERTGYAFTQNLMESPEEILWKAYENSCYMNGEKQEIHSQETAFHKEQRIEKKQEEMPEIDGEMITQIKEMLFSLEKQVGNSISYLSDVEVLAEVVTTASHVVNSKGVDAYYESRYYSVELVGVASVDGTSYNGRAFQMVKTLSELSTEKCISELRQNLENQFHPGTLSPGCYKAVLDKYAVCNMMITIWKLFSAKYYDGNASIFSGKLGEQIASEALTIVDYKYDTVGGYCRPFDFEGSRGRDVTLIKKGIFQGLMHNLKTAMVHNESVTGNAGRAESLIAGMPSDYTIVPCNIYICPGERSVDQLLKAMGDGVYITETYDQFHSINPTSGEFSIPCKGVVIRNGKKEMAANALTISGNLKELFKGIVEVGNDLHREVFFTGAYAYGCPSLRVEALQITN